MVEQATPAAMKAQHVAGAVVAVVSGCQKVFAHGYGWADLAARKPMDAERSLFRIGSIAKVVTATVAMNLAASGTIDLDGDIRKSLPEDFPQPAFGQPVAIRQLLTHSSGFAERWTGLATEHEHAIQSYESFLRRLPPPQVRPPGTIKIYNSTAFALAALVMERATGRDFATLTRDVLRPAGLTMQTLSPSAEQIPHLVTGYVGSRNDSPFARGFHLHIGPGGDGVASADDMAQFIRLHLGCENSATVLSPRDLAEMHRTQFTHHPAVPGMALGFEEMNWKGRRWLKKAGGAPGVTTFMAFVPDSGFGFFVGVNADQSPLWLSLMAAFADKLATQAEHPQLVIDEPTLLEPSTYAGWYRPLRYAPDTFEKLLGLAQRRVTIGANGVVYAGREYRPIGGSLFQTQDGAQVLGFRMRPDGRPDLLFQNGSDGYEAVSWWETLPVQLCAIAGFALTFVAAGVYLLVRVLARRFRSEPGARQLLLALLTAATNTVFLAGVGYSMATFDIWIAHFGVPAGIRFSLLLPPIAIALLLLLLWQLVNAREGRALRTFERAAVFVVAASATLFVPFLWYWNLLELPT